MQNPFIANGEAATAITLEDDPKHKGQVIARIQAISREHVQAEINRLLALVELKGGWAMFDVPFRQYNGFTAAGRIRLQNWGEENGA